MIKLKIKKPGYTIAIPGISPFRTPAEIDISDTDIRTIALYLKANGIDDYEIVAKTEKGHVEVYTKKEFEAVEKPKDKNIENRFSQLEKRVEQLINIVTKKESGKSENNKEQIINNRLENIEDLLQQSFSNKTITSVKPQKNDEPEIEEFDAFVPDIDISDMKFKSKDHKVIRQDDDKKIEDSADALSSLMRGKNNV